MHFVFTIALLSLTAALPLVNDEARAPSPNDAPTAPSLSEALARVRAYEQARIELIERLRPTVTCIFPEGSRAGGGSGVIVDPSGYGLTNYHVIAGMLGERRGEAGLIDGELYDLEVLGIDPGGDMAMFQIRRPAPFPAATLGDAEELRVGDYTLAIGNPFLLAEDYAPTVTLGVISGLNRYQWGQGRALRYTDSIQVDTSINPGNSGGPLFNLAGELVGINGRVSIEERGAVNVGVGYAITINQIRRFMPALRAGYAVKHATAGFTVHDRMGGTQINEILRSSPAYAAGLRLNDEIVEFGGTRVHSANTFVSLLGTYPAGWPVSCTYRRDDKLHRCRFRLLELPFPDVPNAEENPFETYADDPASGVANRRATNHAFEEFLATMGGRAVAQATDRLTGSFVRRRPENANADPPPIALSEQRAKAGAVGEAPDRDAIERALRWSLLSLAENPAVDGHRVLGGDEIQSRVCVVIAREADELPAAKFAFDDDDGHLLAILFDDPTTGDPVRVEYADHGRAGLLHMPHTRRWFVNDELVYEDAFSTLTAAQ